MIPSSLFVDTHVADSPETLAILSRIPLIPVRVDDVNKVFDIVSADRDPVRKGKEVLFLTRNKGPFVKMCPGTRAYTCCGYRILHIGTYCTMDCSYCILQQYFHPPVLQYFVNTKDLLVELDRLFRGTNLVRIGTGEFTDSLIWERWTDLSALLIPKFSMQSKAALELKTKTTNIKRLHGLRHNKKTVVSWSMNTDKVVREEERFTARISERIAAAAKCESWGYPIGFHFDPLILYEGWENDYRSVINRIFSKISPDRIVWISLGAFRFVPHLKSIIRQRFSQSKIVYGEFVPGLDGKMRYFKPLRIEMYRKMAGWIKDIAPEVIVYLCMEDDEVWVKSLGYRPVEHGGLPQMLDESASKHCGLY
jgi:spore photoproduct lyase